MVWIEAQEALAISLTERMILKKQRVIHAAIWDIDGIILDLNVTNNSQSTSLLEFGTHKNDYPDVHVSHKEKVSTKRIDSIFDEGTIPDFINLDIQGAEIRALKSCGKLLSKVKYVYCEVNKKEVYLDCPLVDEIDELLSGFGFERVTTRWVPYKGWGDAFYVNTEVTRISMLAKLVGKSFELLYTQYYFLSVAHFKFLRTLRKLKNSFANR
ncbi:methyltransferase [Candidatus Planktophila versatilis]|uniref:Methyltransferase n=1 Tax=Candidatus Planktophila versatilis TaxID=1884905 RepID=A0ABN5BFY8_9ACTN|nr:methyltransferase [Candidatus Planktophila versatilis]